MDRRPPRSKNPPPVQSSSDETSKLPPKPTAQVSLEAIAHTVSTMSPEAMLRLMEEMREMVKNESERVSRLLSENPQLAYALLQVLVVMRKVSPDEAYAMLHPRPVSLTTPFHYERPPTAAVQMPDVRVPPPSLSRVRVPQEPLSLVKPEPAQSPPIKQPKEPAIGEGEQTKLLLQLLALSEEQIRLLPPLEQAQVRELRKRFNEQ